jgi:hypothetical protein
LEPAHAPVQIFIDIFGRVVSKRENRLFDNLPDLAVVLETHRQILARISPMTAQPFCQPILGRQFIRL